MRRSEALQALEVGEYATSAEIKAAYRDLVKVWHPDRFGSDERLRQRAEERLQQINEAYRRLESGDLEQEPVTRAEPFASGASPMRTPGRKQRDAVLRGWMYPTIAVMVCAFVGYAVVEYARARPGNEIAPSASPEVPAMPAAMAVPSTTTEAGTRPKRASPVRVTHLTEAQMEQLEAACGGFAPDSERHADCVRTQIGAMTGSSRPRPDGLERGPDLSGLTSGERTSLDRVCAGATNYSQCTAEQVASLATVPLRPDLSRLSARDRSAIERACSSARDHDGPAAYDRCVAEAEKMLVARGN